MLHKYTSIEQNHTSKYRPASDCSKLECSLWDVVGSNLWLNPNSDLLPIAFLISETLHINSFNVMKEFMRNHIACQKRYLAHNINS